ncbi:hypothetical protein Q5752_000112 [Cryptotrichosporon argae]
MADRRRQEIEEKRAKLAELRRARDERKQLLAQADQVQPLTTSRKDVNDLVDSLLTSTRPGSPAIGTSRPSSAAVASSEQAASAPGTPGGRVSRLSNDGSEARRSVYAAPQSQADGESFQPAVVDYVDTHTELYELPSKVTKPETYSKSVQTSVSVATGPDADEDDEDRAPRRLENGRESEDEMRSRILAEMEEERKALEAELRELKVKSEQKVAELSSDQRQAIFSAPDFSSFIEESARIVQRALSDNYDYIRDYTIGIDGAFDDNEGSKVKLCCAFEDERWTAGRSVTDLDWSPKFHELVVASYNKNPARPNDPDGIVAVWNLHLLERPEFVFHSPSDVLSVSFSPFHPTLVFGGSYSGQVLLWDTRARHLPVLKTPLSAAGHTYPIYALKVVGTQNANSLISTSTDGLVCAWQADMLSAPQEALALSLPGHAKTDEVAISCFGFAESETATFWVGTEEGTVYTANRYDRAAAKAGLNADDAYRAHAGPVTGLDVHPASGSVDFSDLVLTSSVDWTVKLWRSKGAKASSTAPLHSFEAANDYVFDVKWHPNHPALFGTVDGTGRFDLWNLNHDPEVPLVSMQTPARALNKLAWDRAPLARRAGLGGEDGKLYVYDIGEKVVTPRESEWQELQRTVQGLGAREVEITSSLGEKGDTRR